ncbi:Rid family detoxifying hydrolase [Fluviicola taffensis]|uniref:Endoribonuclease L-PSP n=1 Tax=Fluviicola taffensis (strain DSM 16823 / NCIMB 13979 / RW262) TaxID=755732 RepID=F2IFE9_FLUTR|nr:Rid family detoxifying hydrolase [Fluviicola taffensis]AEA44634.1 endoribonuclease L-PSP [Fluviicola taffensis DSM 16823]
MKKAIQIPGAPAPIGPYSQAIVSGNTVYVSGQIPLNPFTGELEVASIEDATHQILKNIEALLKEADMNLNHIVKCSIFMTDLGQFSEMNAVYGSYFQDVPPARETVQVSKLPMNVPIEISCIAIK